MKQFFKTQRDINGNTYTLEINHTEKTYRTDCNPFNYSDYITIGKRDRARMIKELKETGYTYKD